MSGIFDSLGEALRRAFTPAGTGALEAGTQQAVWMARQKADQALTSQRGARDAIMEAATPALDREDVRVASEARLRRMLQMGGFSQNFGGPTGPAEINYKQLFGASS